MTRDRIVGMATVVREQGINELSSISLAFIRIRCLVDDFARNATYIISDYPWYSVILSGNSDISSFAHDVLNFFLLIPSTKAFFLDFQWNF